MSLFPCWDCGHAHQLHLTLHEFWGLDLKSRVYVATFYTRSHLSDPPNCINTAVTEPLATFFFFLKDLPGAAMAVLHFTLDEAPRVESYRLAHIFLLMSSSNDSFPLKVLTSFSTFPYSQNCILFYPTKW